MRVFDDSISTSSSARTDRARRDAPLTSSGAQPPHGSSVAQLARPPAELVALQRLVAGRGPLPPSADAAQREDAPAGQVVQREPAPAPTAAPASKDEPAAKAAPAPDPNKGEADYFRLVAGPLWREQLELLWYAERNYRAYLLAVRCLQVAKGPGADPVGLADFVRRWKLPLTAPGAGAVAVLKKIVQTALGLETAPAFDPTGAINIGIKLIAQLGPLLGKIQLRNALLVVLDESVIDPADQGEVGTILESAGSIDALFKGLSDSKNRLQTVWGETLAFARKVESRRVELGLPESVLGG